MYRFRSRFFQEPTVRAVPAPSLTEEGRAGSIAFPLVTRPKALSDLDVGVLDDELG
jgi:hypothetical protein